MFLFDVHCLQCGMLCLLVIATHLHHLWHVLLKDRALNVVKIYKLINLQKSYIDIVTSYETWCFWHNVLGRLAYQMVLIMHHNFIWDKLIWKSGMLLKWKCHHFDENFVNVCTWSCQNDNFHCSQWWKFHQDDFSVSVLMRFFLVAESSCQSTDTHKTHVTSL